MRRNLPVTATEYEMADGKPIVSKTDLKGKITYVNPYFVEVSGFPEEELLGAPHNLVRHPDMPPEAFEDLWLTLKAGIPWTGLVKNRRKNGDYYWVVANVTPVIENGQTIGYMSVRTKPSRAQIEAAGDLYARMVAGNAKGIGIRQGNAEPVGVTAMFFKLRNMSLRMRFSLLLGMMMVLFGGMGLAGMSASDAGMTNWFSTAAILGIAGVLLMAYLLHASIALPLQSAIKAARTIAGGDLTGKIASGRNDDMGQLLKALQQMNVNLVAIIGDVMRNVASMGTATREIATGNMDLSNRTESQASSLEETAASMEELSSTVRQNAENARQANRLALSASEVAVKGRESVARVGTTMSDISEASKKIVDIISLIDSIAFQTNILALNAAVEAARAGEQGKGFAVVATEVRSLAQRTAGAAKEIKGLISNSMEKVALGNRMVNEAGETMTEIVHSVEGVTTIMNDIASSSHEQSSGIEQVNQAVSHMDEVTQQNAAMVEQAAAAAASLDEQAVQLSQAVSVFHFGGGSLHGTQEAALPSNVRPLRQLPVSRAPRSRQLTNEKVAAYR